VRQPISFSCSTCRNFAIQNLLCFEKEPYAQCIPMVSAERDLQDETTANQIRVTAWAMPMKCETISALTVWRVREKTLVKLRSPIGEFGSKRVKIKILQFLMRMSIIVRIKPPIDWPYAGVTQCSSPQHTIAAYLENKLPWLMVMILIQ
jgi:hypothetical protein